MVRACEHGDAAERQVRVGPADACDLVKDNLGLPVRVGGRGDEANLALIFGIKRGPAPTGGISGPARIDADRVNVKATTTEKLGFTGRGEGIAAEAVCVISKLAADNKL